MTTKVRLFLTLLSLQPSISPIALVPFLPVRDEFHPKRNQARQKLATLPLSRFRDLSSDVYYGLVSRYPQFKEEVCHILSPLIGLFLDPFPRIAFRCGFSRLSKRSSIL
jgi:Spa2 homology domain (SHD) of GIT